VAVVDEAWRAVWWPWLLVWVATVGLLVVAAAIVVAHRRSWIAERRRHDTCILLDDDSVIDLYQQSEGRTKAALRKEVQERISSTKEVGGSAALQDLSVSAKGGVNSEVFKTYVEEAKPISVVSVLIDALLRADAIVDVELKTLKAEPRSALGALRDERIDEGIRLGHVRAYVSISGEFKLAQQQDEDTITLVAPFGEPNNPDEAPRVLIVFPKDGLRGDKRPFGQARCIGKVVGWNAGNRTLTVDPIGLFR
jgi:hypothetical protein